MEMQIFTGVIEKIWQKIHSDRPFNLVSQSDNSFIYSTAQEAIASELVDALWARLVTDLCERDLVHDAFSVPFRRFPEYAVMWVDDRMIVFTEHTDIAYPRLEPPKILHPVMISIGGPSGAGKTTVVRRMKARLQEQMMTHPAFTTRPQRDNETEGVDYYFRDLDELNRARQDPRYTGFVEARENWYWINPSELLQRIWENPDKIHVLLNSQRDEFLLRKKLFSQLQWVWLDADPANLEQRLRNRGDANIEESLAHNARLRQQYSDDLVNLRVITRSGELDAAVDEVITFCFKLQDERRKE